MNWIRCLAIALSDTLFVTDCDGITGKLSIKLIEDMKKAVRAHCPWTKPISIYVPTDCTISDRPFFEGPDWNSESFNLFNVRYMGIEFKPAPAYLTQIYLDSGYKLPDCKSGLVAMECEDGTVVWGAY